MKTSTKVFIVIGVVAAFGAAVLLSADIYFKWFYVILLSCFFALIRLFKGPTALDRAVALKIISIIVVGFCAIMSAFNNQHIYIDIAIAWVFQAFVGTMVLAKYLEGKNLDD